MTKLLKEKGIELLLSEGVAATLVRSSQSDNGDGDIRGGSDNNSDSDSNSSSSDEVAAFGARPLKRLIQNSLLSPCANYILQGSVEEGDRLLIAPKGDAAAEVAGIANNAEEFSPFTEVHSSLGDKSDRYSFFVAKRK